MWRQQQVVEVASNGNVEMSLVTEQCSKNTSWKMVSGVANSVSSRKTRCRMALMDRHDCSIWHGAVPSGMEQYRSCVKVSEKRE